MSMTDPTQETTTKSNDNDGEVAEETKIDQVYGSTVRVIQEKYMYNLKDASIEIRNKSKKPTFRSDSLILTPHDLRCNQRQNMCNEHQCKGGYYTNAVPDVRWKRERPVNPPAQYFQGASNGGRRWNLSPVEFSRPPFEMPPPSARRKYLQRSLTSSEILGPNYRCLPALPNQKPHKNSFCNSNKSIPTYDGVHTMPAAYQLKREGHCSKSGCHNTSEKETLPGPCKSVPVIPPQSSSVYSSSSDASLDPKAPSTVSTLPMGSQKHIDSTPGLRPSFGSQYSLSGSQCCPNCHMLSTSNRRTMPERWHSQSTWVWQ